MNEGVSQEFGDNGPSQPVSWWAALAAIAATYVYFLIFAEFAFLELARAIAPAAERLRWLMLGLGAGGVAGAVIGARVFRPARARGLLAAAFRACAAAALIALIARSFLTALVAAVAVGVSLGWLTVTLTAALRGAAGGRRLGLCIGAGTGLAYACCNLPWLFRAPAVTQTAVAVVVVVAASYAARGMANPPAATEAVESDYAPTGVTRWVVILLALVWMDSAVFYIIQHTASLRAATWGDSWMLSANAVTHLVAAVGAGLLLDRGWRGSLAGAATALLAIACLILNGRLPAILPAAWIYTAGVSLYSTVLVDYPARSGRPGIAAVVFAVAGWIGSALGIGMAQDLAQVPVVFVVTAGAVVAAALVWRTRTLRVAGFAAIVVAAVAVSVKAEETDPIVARGREVYIAEGCIHCHSQYVRPHVARDVLRWGPAASWREAVMGEPPLLGNRRQGPDLARVGNRRSPEWNRLHLIAPRAVSPGSRMPAYGHLFAAGDGRGEALVAYLASLGAETLPERQAQIADWKPDARETPPPAESRRLFVKLCAPCHGESGWGDGAVAAKLSARPPDWSQTTWRFVPPGAALEPALGRIIRFGLPGLPMAGHECLEDREVIGLARFVQTLHLASGAASMPAVQP